ncbi:MAG: ArnT family glycosyltransferase [Thermomicrobiales bacterium]
MDFASGDSLLAENPQERRQNRRASVADLMTKDGAGRFVTVLLFLFLVKQLVLVVVFPPFTGHDEVAHFAYIQTVATEQRVPELLVDDLPDYFYRYCLYILDWSPCTPEDPRWRETPFRFADWGASGIHPAGQQYTANHPPLYYALAAPVYRLTASASFETQQYLIRLLAIPFGMLTVLLAFLTVRAAFPGDRFMAIVVPTVVAFQPQVSYEASMVNHDIVGIAAVGLILFLLVVGMRDRFPVFVNVALGVTLGVALLIKGNTMIIAPVISLAMIMAVGWRNISEWVPKGAVVAGLAGLITAPWYVYLWRTYGNFDALDQVEKMQEPWNVPAGTFSEQLFNRSYVWDRWQETWGSFGWRRIALGDWLLWLIALPVILALVGLTLLLVRRLSVRKGADVLTWLPGGQQLTTLQTRTMVIFAALFIISYLAVIEFGTRFALTQSRYLFPTINAVAVLLSLGLRTLSPARIRPFVQGFVVSAMILLTLVIYTKYVVPYWHFTDWSAE